MFNVCAASSYICMCQQYKGRCSVIYCITGTPFYFFIFKFIYLYDLYIEEQGEEGNGTPGIIIYSSADITTIKTKDTPLFGSV